MSEQEGGFQAGQSALIAPVPEAEPVVGAWRQRYDASAAAGVPAHVTVLSPFLDLGLVTPEVLVQLAALFAGHIAFDVRLAAAWRFPGVLYLAPEPERPLRELTSAVAARWPQAPPYGGQFEDVVPHLTVAHGQPAEVFDTIEADVAGRLPVRARISSVRLLAFDGLVWRREHSFTLAEAQPDTASQM